MNDFCSLTGAKEGVFEKMWSKYAGLIYVYALLESKKSVKHLMKLYLSAEKNDKGTFSYMYVCRCMLMVILALFHRRS